VLVGCAGSVLLTVALWPDRSVGGGQNDDPRTSGREWTPPDLPDDPVGPTYDEPDPPSAELSVADLLPGVWQCARGTDRITYGTAMQFFTPVGTSGSVFMSSDPYGATEWIEAEYELGLQGYVTISPVAYLYAPVSSHFVVRFSDANTMLMYSAEEGDENMSPAVMQRVQ
jgi:hypothetical protein